ncbi:MAG: radical SAM protein [Candidatus Gracilibacteria bacterium]|nr:radical SAM protein [Candidatus Gracilibacteria bacterium]
MTNFPNDIMIEVTNVCNLKCTTCYSHQDDRHKKYMDFSVFKKIIDEIPEKNTKTISLYNYGEPLMHKQIGEFIKYAKLNGIKNIKIATNGTFLTANKSVELINAGLDYLSISVDGTTQEIYEKFRVGGNLNQIIKNIQILVKLKEKLGYGPIVELQFIIMSHNENQVENIKLLAEKLGVDVLRYKTVLIKEKQWSHLIPKNNNYTRYKEVTKTISCNKPNTGIVINVDGKIIPCCYITDKYIDIHSLGNINDNNLEELYNSNKSQKFVNDVFRNKQNVAYCCDCEEGNMDLDYKVIKIYN